MCVNILLFITIFDIVNLSGGVQNMKKSEIVLFMFYHLLQFNELTKSDVMEEFKITTLTFARYLSDIRCFLIEKVPELEVVYDKVTDKYLLKKSGIDC